MHWARKSDLEVTTRYINEVEAVQHVHLTNIPVWLGLLGDIKNGRTYALDLRMLLGIKWHQIVRNDNDVRYGG